MPRLIVEPQSRQSLYASSRIAIEVAGTKLRGVMVAIKAVIRRLFEAAGYSIRRLPKIDRPIYAQDGLESVHNHDFMIDGAFQRAYARGCRTGADYRWHWRVHIGLWAASTAARLDGDFVECGVNRGFLSSAIMEFLNWNSLKKTFYLLDTFEGLDPKYVSEDDRLHGATEENNRRALESGYYTNNVESVRENFSEWRNVRIVKGSIPDSLSKVDVRRVAYLHLDMNCSPPEVAAIEFFWDKMVAGGVVLLDDYAYSGYESQKRAMDAFAARREVMIASLPTGQGLLMKPPQ